MKNLNANLSGLVFAAFLFSSSISTWAQSAEALEEIRIGKQVWSLKNLDVSYFRNGDPITEARTAEEWNNALAQGKPAWCYYENDPDYGARFQKPQEESVLTGKLYNWFAVDDPRGLAPVGWHVPSQEEWDTLTVYLGGMPVADAKIMVPIGGNTASSSQESRQPQAARRAPASRRSASHEDAPSQASISAHGGTNSSGFTALPGGSRGSRGEFTGYGSFGYWWSSTELSQWPLQHTYTAWYRHLTFFDSLKTDFDFLTSPTLPAGNGLSVRVVKN